MKLSLRISIMHSFVVPPRATCHPSGMTLMEVLVACGVLLLGLSGIAGLMAATATLLGEASNLDRGGSLTANAPAEFTNRQICTLETYQASTALPGCQTACLGDFSQQIQSISAFVSASSVTSAPLVVASDYISSRIDGSAAGLYRSFLSEDRLRYVPGSNGIPIALTGNLVHETQPGTCWGGLLTPVDFLETPVPFQIGSAAPHPPSETSSPNRFRALPSRLDVAVFKKPAFALNSANAVLLLTATGGGFTLTGSSSDVQSSPFSAISALQNTFLRGCSFVLAMPPTWSSIPPATVLPQPPAGQADSAVEGLKVLDRWNGQRVNRDRYLSGLKLKQSYFDPQRQRIFFVVVDAAGSAQAELDSSEVASLFGEGASLSDAVSTRTKTVGAYTIRLPTRQDMQAVLTTTPSGWSTSRRYWTSTNGSENNVWTYDLATRTFQTVSRIPTDRFFVALEVAVAPTWYRIQSSWVNRNAPNVVCVSFTDPTIFEFPRVASGSLSKLRVAAFQGLMGVESRFLMVE